MADGFFVGDMVYFAVTFILHGGAVDGDHCSICQFQLHAGSINIKFT